MDEKLNEMGFDIILIWYTVVCVRAGTFESPPATLSSERCTRLNGRNHYVILIIAHSPARFSNIGARTIVILSEDKPAASDTVPTLVAVLDIHIYYYYYFYRS